MKVTLVSYTDEWIANKATQRCRSGKPYAELGDKNVLDHALGSGHDSVLEFVDYTFAIDGISRACSHQLVRHRMASYEQTSQRHVNMDRFEYVIPKTIEEEKGTIEFRYEDYAQQMTTDTIPEAYQYIMDEIHYVYSELIRLGVPEEDARYILPNACATNLVMKINARSLKNFLSLRMCNKAQWEIRELADKMYKLVCEYTPQVAEYMGPPCWFDGCKELNPCAEGRPKAVTMKKR